MATWKRVLLEGEGNNIGGTNLTTSDVTRSLTLNNTVSKFLVKNQGGGNVNSAAQNVFMIDESARASGTTIYRLGDIASHDDSRAFFHTSSQQLGAGKTPDGITNYSAEAFNPNYGFPSGFASIDRPNSLGNGGYFDGNFFAFNTPAIPRTSNIVSPDAFSVRIQNTAENHHNGSHQPVVHIVKRDETPALSERLGCIDFRAPSAASSSAPAEKTFAKIGARIDKTGTIGGGNLGGGLHFDVKSNSSDLLNVGNTVSDFHIEPPEDDDAGNHTVSENKLKSLYAQGTDLRSLTSRGLCAYQFGFNNSVSSSSTSTFTFTDMKGINGVVYTSKHGFCFPVSGWIVGASVSYVSDASAGASGTGTGQVAAKLYKIQDNNLPGGLGNGGGSQIEMGLIGTEGSFPNTADDRGRAHFSQSAVQRGGVSTAVNLYVEAGQRYRVRFGIRVNPSPDNNAASVSPAKATAILVNLLVMHEYPTI